MFYIRLTFVISEPIQDMKCIAHNTQFFMQNSHASFNMIDLGG